MANFRDFISGNRDRRSTDEPQPVLPSEPAEEPIEDRRAGDRRNAVDLTRPPYLERREHRDSRREADQARIRAESAALPFLGNPAPTPTEARSEGARPLPELEAEFQELQAAMDRRLRAVKDLSDEEFEAIQAHAETLVTAWAVEVKSLEAEIASERKRQAEG